MSAAEVIAEALRSCGIEESEKVEVPDVLDALKAAGYAVVELPKPGELSDHHSDGDVVFYYGQAGEIQTHPGEIWDNEGQTVPPAVAREWAAALLAAADAAEPAPDPHAGQLWANELLRRQRQVPTDREWS